MERKTTSAAVEPKSVLAAATSWARSVHRSSHSSSLKDNTTDFPRYWDRLTFLPFWSVRVKSGALSSGADKTSSCTSWAAAELLSGWAAAASAGPVGASGESWPP